MIDRDIYTSPDPTGSAHDTMNPKYIQGIYATNTSLFERIQLKRNEKPDPTLFLPLFPLHFSAVHV
jgi:hypothetical protein